MSETLLEVQNLWVEYHLGGKRLTAIDGISFKVKHGEVMGVAGESGCGKTTLGLAIMRLLPKMGHIVEGSMRFKGRDLAILSESLMDREIRGKQISMIFQNPQTAINPVFRIETQMIDVLRFQKSENRSKTKEELRRKAVQLLRDTGIADPEGRISNYPFEFSGGMKQRVMIAMALSSGTTLLVADEPTTALDVTIEAQINELLMELATKYKTSILYISHDLGVLSEISDRVMVMYAGRLSEIGPTNVVFEQPAHPYTAALIKSLPGEHSKGKRLLSIPGQIPPLDQLPPGCTFSPRCQFSQDQCLEKVPPLVEVGPGHQVACLLARQKDKPEWKWI